MSAALLVVAVPIGYVAAVKIAAQRASGIGMRANWPQKAIAERFSSIWTRETGAPLRIVAGDPWLAGLVGLAHKDTPSILTNGDMTFSPWITPSRIDREGTLIVWETGIRDSPPKLFPLPAARKTGEERFNFTYGRNRRELVIGYAIVPPKAAAR